MNLSERLQDVLRGSRRNPTTPPPASGPGGSRLEEALGGTWLNRSGHRLFVVERRWSAAARHGEARVGDIAGALRNAASALALFAPAPLCAHDGPLLFFDLETTGLSGGAGTYAFLVGCGWFEPDGVFATRQYVLAEHGAERAMLQEIAGDLSRCSTLVSFNGKSFDAPVIETRYLYHRLEWAGGAMPHFDVLHQARRFWGSGECSLGRLEADVLGASRGADVMGFEIPARYFHFLRSGDAAALVPVLTHNQLDLLSLAALAARLFDLVERGADVTSDPQEALALGFIYDRSRLDRPARLAFERAVELGRDVPSLRLTAMRALAVAERRARRFDAAATWWHRVLDAPRCPPRLAREAAEALAIHAEHRARDLTAARSYALQSFDTGARHSWNDAVRHRVERIDRKMSRAGERYAPLLEQASG
jgi:uncharacterized protein